MIFGLAALLAMALSVSAQINFALATNTAAVVPNSSMPSFPVHTNEGLSFAPSAEQIRTACIQGRRSICGKILKVLPDGLVVESGYTNLLRAPLTRSWLAPGTVSATRAPNLIEGSEPNAVCVGLIFLTNLPKSRGAKPKLYDYVLIEGYPAGQYTYASVGNIHRTVRKFSASLEAAIKWNLNHAEK